MPLCLTMRREGGIIDLKEINGSECDSVRGDSDGSGSIEIEWDNNMIIVDGRSEGING